MPDPIYSADPKLVSAAGLTVTNEDGSLAVEVVKLSGGHPGTFVTTGRPTFDFDNHRFGSGHAMLLGCIHLAHKARNGDARAKSILVAFKVVITDVDGKTYWPIDDKEDKSD